ncbi:MAG: hypothetical protein QGH51_02285 [Planctomycetota bacterium]|jgi:hypothetical protein|nr:hypothetical protein [Planctomycetota bacterium]
MFAVALLFLPCVAPPALPISPPQSLGDIEKTLKKATNKSGYEDRGYAAARSLADIQTPEAMELRLKYFDRLLDTYRGVYLRDWFYSGMLKARSVEETELLAKTAANKKASPLLRLLCLQAIELCPGPIEAKPLMHKNLVKGKDIELFRAWQRALGHAYANGRLVLSGWRKKDPDAEVMKALGKESGIGLLFLQDLSNEQREELLDNAINSKEDSDRAELLFGLANRGDFSAEELLPVIASALGSSHTGLRSSAIYACKKNSVAASVPLLIHALEREVSEGGGRFVIDYGDTLMELTGLKMGRSPEMWNRWWNGSGEKWLSEGGQATNRGMKRPEEETKATLFGIPIHSNKIVFAVDGSGSMNGALGKVTRAEAAATELHKLLDVLPEDALFDVAIVENTMRTAFGGLKPNIKKNRTEAIEFIERCTFQSRSALYDALTELQDNWGADTIVLIGDGGSSNGTHQYTGHILAGLKKRHPRTGVRIHTVAVGASGALLNFMRYLATDSGGTMVEPKD